MELCSPTRPDGDAFLRAESLVLCMRRGEGGHCTEGRYCFDDYGMEQSLPEAKTCWRLSESLVKESYPRAEPWVT